MKRRTFLKLGLAGSALLLTTQRGNVTKVFSATLKQAALDPTTVAKYVTPLVIPPAMPRSGRLRSRRGRAIDYYEIAVRQFTQQVLPAGLPATTVWGFGSLVDPRPVAEGGTLNFPSLTIEARTERPVRIKWVNDLKDGKGNFLPHLLPVDPTLHWANPAQGSDPRYGNGPKDFEPTFAPGTVVERYVGPVPFVAHLHGAKDVGDESDGYAEAWFLPDVKLTGAYRGYASDGTWYKFFKEKFAGERRVGHSSDVWAKGSATFQYPNTQRASALWFHDHTLGMTRLNVYAGPAGFYMLRGGDDDRLFDKRKGDEAKLPGPAPQLGDRPGKAYREIPLAIQDRSFNADGSLFYPDSRAYFGDMPEGWNTYIPDSDIAPFWNPEFFGDTMLVNGKTWPFLEVEPRRYRLRILNGCNSRFLILRLSQAGMKFWVIGNEGGFIPQPVELSELLMSPAERLDVIVDFAGLKPGAVVELLNVGPDEPFGGGVPGVDFASANPETTGRVLQFKVVKPKDNDKDETTPPQYLRGPKVNALPAPSGVRPLALIEMMSMTPDPNDSTATIDAPVEAALGTFDAGFNKIPLMWDEPISENPAVGTVEEWEFYNFTADAHPMHIHEVLFQVINRQPLATEDVDGEAVVIEPAQLAGTPTGPEAWEAGWKDTVIAYPGQVTRVRMQFTNPGRFVWHCHIVEHEDNEMMRPYHIGPNYGPSGATAVVERIALPNGTYRFVCKVK